MGRKYVVGFSKVSVSAIQDLFRIAGAAGMSLEIASFSIDCVDTVAPADQQLAMRCRILPATVTTGSGGTAPTPQKLDMGDPVATFAARANDTAQATSSGTAIAVWAGGCNVKAGIEKHFVDRPIIGPAQSFTVELITATVGTLLLSGSVVVIEKGG